MFSQETAGQWNRPVILRRYKYPAESHFLDSSRKLLLFSEGDGFWVLPGGRAELGEPAKRTLIREMREELGVDVEVVRLLWVVENFFTYANRRHHELSLYFLMRLPPRCKYLVQPAPFLVVELEGTPLTFDWFPAQAEELSSLPLLPSFLQTALQALPNSPQHIVHNEMEST